jgi:hypothetical protein
MADATRSMTDEDWFNLGREDGWFRRPKQPPQDPQAASLYDLGYSEGVIEHPPTASAQGESNSSPASD